MAKYKKTITRIMARITRTTHARPPGGGPTGLAFLPFAGLNFAISFSVAPRHSISTELRTRSQHARIGLMTRRTWLWLSAGLVACGEKRGPAMEPFPETVAGWQRKTRREVPVSEAPDPVPRTSVRRLEIAEYQGQGKLEARAYELTSKTAGLDLAQRWRPSADTVFFWAGDYFVVVKWQEADRKALQAFTRDVEQRLNGK